MHKVIRKGCRMVLAVGSGVVVLAMAGTAASQSNAARGWGSSASDAVGMLRGHAATFCFQNANGRQGFDVMDLTVEDTGSGQGPIAMRFQARATIVCNGQDSPPSRGDMLAQAQRV